MSLNTQEYWNTQDLINNGLLNQLAACFQGAQARLLLTAIGFPAGLIPNLDRIENWLDFWFKVCQALETGVIGNGFERLLGAASRQLPGNRHFAPFNTIIPATATPTERLARTLVALSNSYDVFLSFSSKDRDFVRSIARSLEVNGIRPWFDEWALPSGSPLVHEIETILSTVRTVVIFYGNTGYGPWQRAETDIALERSLRGDCLVIPVMLPGISPAELPPFLQRLRGIKISTALSADQADAVDRLAQAIRANC